MNNEVKFKKASLQLSGVLIILITTMVPIRGFSQSHLQSNEKPNIIFILVDDLGWRDTGIYGSNFYETPNIDRLASQGMRFINAYASSTVCSPSRSSIMTGQYPVHTGITGVIVGAQNNLGPMPNQKLIQKPFNLNLPKSEITIAEALKDHGYATCFAGKWHLGIKPSSWPKAEGFDYNYGGWAAGQPTSYGMSGYFSPWNNPKLKNGPRGAFLTDQLTSETIKFIKEETKKGEPFFADLSFYAVHEPIQAKKKYIKKFKNKAQRMGLDTLQHFVKDAPWMQKYPSFRERTIQSNPVYAALIYSVDKNVGRILKTLDELGISKNTIVVFTSDNGGLSTAGGAPTSNLPLRYGKGWTYEGGVRVPLLIKWPGVTKPGSVSTFPVINTDFYPTFLQMAGFPAMPKQARDGKSLVPLLKGKKSIHQPLLYWHYPHYGNQGSSPSSAIRKGNWKLIQYYKNNSMELYNLRTDIGEQRDLVKAMPEKVAKMLQLLNQWKKKVHAKIPAINQYYNPYSFKDYMEKNNIKTKWSPKLKPLLDKYDTLFSKKIYNPSLIKKYEDRLRKMTKKHN